MEKLFKRKRATVEVADGMSPKGSYIEDAFVYVPQKSTRNGVVFFRAVVFAAVFTLTLYVTATIGHSVGLAELIIAVTVALVSTMSVHIALSWEKVVVLRLGKVDRVVGPGLFFTIPIVEYTTACIDQRVIATPFYAEKTLTADLVPVTVDAVLYWMVWDAEKACTEVEDYYSAVLYLAQTAMREAVGRSTAAEAAIRRDQLAVEIKTDVEREATSWGVDVISVKVRDIVIPEDLQAVMALEAQADREKNARMTVASAETELAEMLAEAAAMYGEPDMAFRLRTMLMQYETVKMSQSSVVTMPSAVSDGFFDAATGLDKGRKA